MKEIKFRGMDANGVMRYGRLSQDKPNETAYYEEYSQRICWDNSNIPVKNNTLGQYIGLIDQNDKEIYKDDIIRDRWGLIGKVIYRRCWFVVEIIKNCDKDPLDKGELLGNYLPNNIEVIGNKFENPELLVVK